MADDTDRLKRKYRGGFTPTDDSSMNRIQDLNARQPNLLNRGGNGREIDETKNTYPHLRAAKGQPDQAPAGNITRGDQKKKSAARQDAIRKMTRGA